MKRKKVNLFYRNKTTAISLFEILLHTLTFALLLSHSIKVVRQILILFVEVRILVGQLKATCYFNNLWLLF